MPLLDHFHPPLYPRRHWESFHAAWSVGLADALNERWLPEGYFAEVQTHANARVEIDVATYRDEPPPTKANGAAALALTTPVWSPPAPAVTLPIVFPDTFEVRLFSADRGAALVAAIEIISPANKDRAEARRAFAVKCASYLVQGISLIIIDIVTSRQANLHQEIIGVLNLAEPPAPAGPLYAVAYRPVLRQEREEVDIWPGAVAVGANLPTLPLRLAGDQFMPIDFEATYLDTCRRQRLT